ATVTVVAGAQTTVTFTDSAVPGGTVQVCKVAGAGIAIGTNFTFSVAGTPVTVAAGPGPGGTCAAAVAATAGNVAISETIPAGTILSSLSTVPPGALVSSNLAAGTATVTVVAGAQTTVTFTDAATVSAADLMIAKIHVGNFTRGQVGATYMITVSNAPTAGLTNGTAVTVSDSLPAGLSATTISGTGWACTQPAGPCTRSDVLAAGASYPVLTLTVNVSAGATSPLVNTVTVVGGGDVTPANDGASDSTTINFAIQTVTTIPTLDQWGIVALASLLALFAMALLRHRP
ncbi:MAG: IPTL-CTERM sorting domain-containing protein, partial [Casimicrobiaceae bacterium]